MRFFQSESHPKPDDRTDDSATDDDATGTVRSEPVPVPRSSDENDVTDDGRRGPDTADHPHLSGGPDDQGTTDPDRADGTDHPHISPGTGTPDGTAADRPHISIGAADADPADTDRSADGDPDGTDSSVRTGEPADADVVPGPDSATGTGSVPVAAGARRDDEEPVFVEPVPQETAFGAATVGGAVAASELAARRETDDPDATATVRPIPAEPTDAFGTPVTAGFGGAAQAPHDFGRAGDTPGDDPVQPSDESGHAGDPAQSPHEFGRAGDPAQSSDRSGPAGEPDGSPSEFGRAGDTTDREGFGPANGRDQVEGFGPADGRGPEPVEGFGTAGARDTGEAGTDKPLRAEGLTATEGFGTADDPDRSARLAAEDRPEDEQTRSHAAETAALGVAGGAAAGAAVVGAAAVRNRNHPATDPDGRAGSAPTTTDRDGDGRPDTGRAGTDRDGDGRPDTGRAATDRDGDGWPDAEPISNDRDGDGRLDDEPTGAAGTAAVPIEPIPEPADAEETPATVDEPVELLPGDVPEQPALAAFFTERTAGDFRDRWREVQLRFVDDPARAAADAGTLIDEVVAALNAAITEQREALGGSTTGQGDTEQLRVLVRRQRDFLDRILGL
ncbi:MULTISPECIES: hypothetical protein [Catenuloplanes]|uniref:Uncharacterized protein n=1 Tax=Catenuloplanes niger TaxID=587534 RepID=A0AAE4CS78_9ACTN|nr:hypothetical protein [Catenuloplanes niger]MDR7322227.1 hypothetical protein [Catenuloplanes niger]